MGTTERVAKLIPENVVVAALSGIKSRKDVLQFKAARASAVLVGETLMKSSDVAATISELVAADK